MSNTTHHSTPAPRNAPTPGPPAELTGAPATVLTALARLTKEVTATDLALAAGVGRSTAGKALTKLEQHGLALRSPGGFDGPHRTPDLWRAAPTFTPSSSTFADHESVDSLLGLGNSDTPESHNSNAGPGDTHTAGCVPDSPAAPDGSATQTAAFPPVKRPLHVSPPGAETDGSADGDEKHPGADEERANPGSEDILITQPGTGQQTSPPDAIILPDSKKRLAPGALRQMVTEHLQAHPNEAFTATRISRVIERSSGAIANALVTLTRQGLAEQVDDQPRTYRLATPENNS